MTAGTGWSQSYGDEPAGLACDHLFDTGGENKEEAERKRATPCLSLNGQSDKTGLLCTSRTREAQRRLLWMEFGATPYFIIVWR